MNTLGVMQFYFPARSFRRYAVPALASRMPENVSARAWERTLHVQQDLAHARPRYSPGINLILRYMEWDTAFYRSAREEGLEVADAGRLIEEVNWAIFSPVSTASFSLSRLRSASLVARVTWIWDVMFKVLFTAPFRRNTYPSVSGVDFDVITCPLAKYFKDQGVPELASFAACSLDHRMAATWGMVLHRSQTIADGHPLCDFRFRTSARDVAQQQVPPDVLASAASPLRQGRR